MTEGRREGKRIRRRQCRHWHDNITEWFGMDIESAKHATDNRSIYSLLVRAATSSGYATLDDDDDDYIMKSFCLKIPHFLHSNVPFSLQMKMN